MVKMKDVSLHAGVSVATVSNVLTGKRNVSPKVRARVMASIGKLDYQVNVLARGLKTQHTSTIGLVLPGITKLFFQKVLNGIISAATEAGYRILIMNSNYDFETERTLVNSLARRYVDGIILDSCAPLGEAKGWADFLTDRKNMIPPVVSIESMLSSDAISSVTLDNALYSSQLTQHLIDTGRRRILFVSGPIYLEHEYARYAGYLECLGRNHINPDASLQAFGDYLSESGYRLVLQKLREHVIFDAVQASSDQAAIGALKALKESGIQVPDSVSLCGFDNVFPSSLVSPAITTVDVPGHYLGYEAVKTLIRLLGDPSCAPLHQTLTASVLIRGSSTSGKATAWDLEDW
jgi:DNA-binding LacI/PurR family transcriptional regulator